MPISLAQGVNLHVIPTKKYKTVRILIRFNTRLERATVTKRALLSSLLETNSLNFPSQVEVSEQLAQLYGANFGVNVSKKGNLHWLNVSMNLVNDKYLNDTTVLSEAVSFLEEMLFSPNIITGEFDHETFNREKENLLSYYESVMEDKQTYASFALQSIYFNRSDDQKIPSFGLAEDLAKETPASVADYYHEMIANDQIDLFVMGDVDEETVAKAIRTLPFNDRPAGSANIFYEQTARNVIEERSEQEPVAQAKLNLGYHTDVYYGDENYFAMQVFNGLFGGFPHSKLFLNVREKENLAYTVYSAVDSFRGLLTVQTGIEGENRNQVLHLISTELDAIRKGKVSETELNQTKAMLKNQYLSSLDNAVVVIENHYLDHLIPHAYLKESEWVRRIEAVTVADVQRVAKLIQLQAIFFLEGEKSDA